MNTPEKAKTQEDIQQIFENLEDMAKLINPDLLIDIKSFNENHVALKSYESFISALNQQPILTTSNHVSQ
jgi:hypothetical protein